MLFEGIYRRFNVLRGGRGQVEARMTFLESLAVAQVEPPGMEGARAGRRFLLGNSAAITGIQSVQALATTGAHFAIWNPDPFRTMFFQTLGVYLTSGTPGVGGALFACLFTTPAQTGTTYAGTSITSASLGGPQSKAIVKASVTITTPAAPNWLCIASNPSPNVTAFASSTYLENRNLDGRLACPPNCGVGLYTLTPAGNSPLFAPFAEWFEAEVDME